MSGRFGIEGEGSAESTTLRDRLALASTLEIRTMMDERSGQIWLGQ